MANSRDLMPITSGPKLDELAETEEMSKALVKQCFMKSPDGGIFIRRAGLLFKTERKFKDVGYSVRTELPTDEEMERLRKMMGLPDGEPFAVAKGIVEVGDRQYTDYGTATLANTNKMTAHYLLEMACTRATNRAMRIATVCGFTSVEELPPRGRPAAPPPRPEMPGSELHRADMDTFVPPEDPVVQSDDVHELREKPNVLDEHDYNATLAHLRQQKVVPWHFMNHLKKHYGIHAMKDMTYDILPEIMELVDKGHFREKVS